MPEVGLEPTWAGEGPLDFESSAYTNFATPALSAKTKYNRFFVSRQILMTSLEARL